MRASHSLLLFPFLFYCLFSNCQKKINPTPEDIRQAETLHDKYEDDDVVLLKGTENITFYYNKAKGTIGVKQSSKENLLSIVPRADIPKYEFYDDYSDIRYFDVKYRNGKSANFPIKDALYEDENIFYNDARLKYTTIDFPVMGYKYCYEVDKNYKDIKYFTKIWLDSEHPILERSLSFEVPDWLDIEFLEFNFEGYQIDKQIVTDEKKGVKKHLYSISEAKPFPKDENAPGPSHTRPHILVAAKSFNMRGKKNKLFNNTQDLYDWYKSLVDQLDDDQAIFKAQVEQLTSKVQTDEEKIKAIYYWVQDNIRYIAFEDGIAGFKPDESQNVFQKRYGDCKGMANLTKQMLISAGFDARLTWIGTKRIAYDYSIPNLAVDNHMICTVFLDEKPFFLDSTEKYCALGEYAERIQGRQVLIENGNDFILDKVPSKDGSENWEKTSVSLQIKDERLIGNVQKKLQGESKSHFLSGYNSIRTNRKNDAIEYFLDGNDNIEVSDIVTSNLENRDTNIQVSYNIALENKVSTFDDEIYIDLEHNALFEEIDLSKRTTDLMFPYKQSIKYLTTLAVPKGYVVKQIPKSVTATNEDFEASISYAQQNNAIVYIKEFHFKKAKIQKTNFNAWNKFTDQLKNIYSEQVVLEKSKK